MRERGVRFRGFFLTLPTVMAHSPQARISLLTARLATDWPFEPHLGQDSCHPRPQASGLCGPAAAPGPLLPSESSACLPLDSGHPGRRSQGCAGQQPHCPLSPPSLSPVLVYPWTPVTPGPRSPPASGLGAVWASIRTAPSPCCPSPVLVYPWTPVAPATDLRAVRASGRTAPSTHRP